MVKGQVRLSIPNPHTGDLDWTLVTRILQKANIHPDEWEHLK